MLQCEADTLKFYKLTAGEIIAQGRDNVPPMVWGHAIRLDHHGINAQLLRYRPKNTVWEHKGDTITVDNITGIVIH